jgi:transcriptional regulator with XRE-family HTH domain
MTLNDAEYIQSLRAGLSDEDITRRSPTAHAGALRLRRRKLKLSVEEAAASLDLTGEELEQIERGELEPTEEQLVKIAALYRLGAEQLIYSFALARRLREAPRSTAPERRLRQAQPRFGAQDSAAFRRHKSQLNEALC